MMRYTLLLLLFFVGYSAANEYCNINPALICMEENFDVKFPENEEEALNLCKAFIARTECFLNFSESCEGDQNEIEQMRNVITYLTEHCQVNDSVYQGGINSLDCMRPIFTPENDECKKSDDEKASKFLIYLMQLSERGIKKATDDDINMMKCLDILYFDACLAAEVGKKCGSAAKNSVIAIFQNLDIFLKICKQEIIDDITTLVDVFES